MNIVCKGQEALDRRRELAVVQIDLSSAFHRESQSGFLYMLRDVGVGNVFF